jgi:hypothetical protein
MELEKKPTPPVEKKETPLATTTIVRVRVETARMLRSHAAKTMDQAIMNMAAKITSQSIEIKNLTKELKEWRTITECKTPNELLMKRLKQVDRLMK